MKTMILLTMISAIMNTGNVETAVANVTCSIRSIEIQQTNGINYVENNDDEGWDSEKVIEKDGCRIRIKTKEL